MNKYRISYYAKGSQNKTEVDTQHLANALQICHGLLYPEENFSVYTVNKKRIKAKAQNKPVFEIPNSVSGVNEYITQNIQNSEFIDSIEVSDVQTYTIGYKSNIGSLIEFSNLTLAEAVEIGLNQIHQDFEFSVIEKNNQLEATFDHTPNGDFSLLTFKNNHKDINNWFLFAMSQYATGLKFVVITKEGEE